jgi:hypothetical protein
MWLGAVTLKWKFLSCVKFCMSFGLVNNNLKTQSIRNFLTLSEPSMVMSRLEVVTNLQSCKTLTIEDLISLIFFAQKIIILSDVIVGKQL